MLDVLRASKGGIITWVFLAAIIVVFVISFGPGSLTHGGGGCGGAPSYAARVNGDTVPVVEFERMYRPYADAYERDPQTRAMLPYYAAQIMNRLVDDTLLAQEAERRGIVITADDLNQELWKNPSFQIDGRFNLEKYRTVAGNMFGSVTAYEDMVKRALRVQRLQAAFMTAVQVPESDVHETWKTMSDTYDLSYVLFATADARAEAKVTDADAQAFAAKEGARIEILLRRHLMPNAARSSVAHAHGSPSDRDARSSHRLSQARGARARRHRTGRLLGHLGTALVTQPNGWTRSRCQLLDVGYPAQRAYRSVA